MKQPEECCSIEEVRMEIDAIDADLINLIGKRAGYVQAAASFKKDKSAVKAPDRIASMLSQRRQWALQHQIDPDVIEALFNTLLDYFLNKEIKAWENKNG